MAMELRAPYMARKTTYGNGDGCRDRAEVVALRRVVVI